jgi:hypothetical protein
MGCPDLTIWQLARQVGVIASSSCSVMAVRSGDQLRRQHEGSLRSNLLAATSNLSSIGGRRAWNFLRPPTLTVFLQVGEMRFARQLTSFFRRYGVYVSTRTSSLHTGLRAFHYRREKKRVETPGPSPVAKKKKSIYNIAVRPLPRWFLEAARSKSCKPPRVHMHQQASNMEIDVSSCVYMLIHLWKKLADRYLLLPAYMVITPVRTGPLSLWSRAADFLRCHRRPPRSYWDATATVVANTVCRVRFAINDAGANLLLRVLLI